MKSRSYAALAIAFLIGLGLWLSMRQQASSSLPRDLSDLDFGTPAGPQEETPRAADLPFRLDATPEQAANVEEVFADYPRCVLPGVSRHAAGRVQADYGEQRLVFSQDGVARLLASESGSGTLLLEGYEPVEISWLVEDGHTHCSDVELTPSEHTLGVFGVALDSTGHPLVGGVLRGCHNTAKVLDDGSFYMALPSNSPCELRIHDATSGRVILLNPMEQDVDLGTITLPRETAAFGLHLQFAVDDWRRQVPPEKYQVVLDAPGSPAYQAGVRAGDYITHVNGKAVTGRHPSELLQVPVGASRSLTLGDGRVLHVQAVPLSELLRTVGVPEEKVDRLAASRGSGFYY